MISKKTALPFLFFLPFFWLGCLEIAPPVAPTLSVSPLENQNISKKKQVTFYVKGTDVEDIVSFELLSTPAIFKIDSTFAPFTHKVDFQITLIFPEVTNVPEDSTIYLDFYLGNAELKARQTRILRIIKSSPEIISTIAILSDPPGGNFFYSTKTSLSYGYLSAENAIIDFAFLYSPDYGYMLCSPDAPFLSTTLTEGGQSYSTSAKNHTKFELRNVSWGSIEENYLNEALIVDNAIAGNALLGSGIVNLAASQIILFQTSDGRKGALKVESTTKSGKVLTLTVKVQKTS